MLQGQTVSKQYTANRYRDIIVFMSGKTNHKKESATISVHQTDHISRYACNRLFQCCDHALGTADRQREKGNEIGFESRSCVIALLTTVWWVKQPSWVLALFTYASFHFVYFAYSVGLSWFLSFILPKLCKNVFRIIKNSCLFKTPYSGSNLQHALSDYRQNRKNDNFVNASTTAVMAYIILVIRSFLNSIKPLNYWSLYRDINQFCSLWFSLPKMPTPTIDLFIHSMSDH